MQSDPTLTTLAALLAEAKEFVEHLSRKEKSGENFVRTAMYFSPAEKLRMQADAMDRHDALIGRARELLPKIEEALRPYVREN